MSEILRVENNADGQLIQYDVVTNQPDSKMEICELDQSLEALMQKADEINKDIAKYTNDSDWIDNTVAIASGIICGIIDSIFVGEFSLENAREWGSDKVDAFVIKVAKSQGYTGNDKDGAILYLAENKKHKNADTKKGFHLAADSNTADFGGGKQHHLRDFAHHPTPVGLAFSMLTQFTEKSYGTDTAGKFIVVAVKNKSFIGKDTPEKFLFGTVYWFFHMVSDMAGSGGNVFGGTGIPGPIVSLLKEVSAIPIFRNAEGVNEFSVWISKLFNGTLLGKRDENGKLIPLKFDLRTEIGVAREIGKQALPVLINECIVRGFYFVRRLCIEVKEAEIKSLRDLKNINWGNTIPAKNRTIVRMLTISSGTFMAFDMADAAIRAAATSGGTAPGFVGQFLVRVNFVGVGRFAVAVGCDASMGIKKLNLEKQISSINTQMIFYKDAKVYYRNAEAWEAAQDATKAIKEATDLVNRAKKFYVDSLIEMNKAGECIRESAAGFVSNNQKTANEILSILSED